MWNTESMLFLLQSIQICRYLIMKSNLFWGFGAYLSAKITVIFVKNNSNSFFPHFFRCYSNVGMINRGQQPVSLGPGCIFKGTIVHELGHALGFFHEQNRSDRDDYLDIYWQNIRPGNRRKFQIKNYCDTSVVLKNKRKKHRHLISAKGSGAHVSRKLIFSFFLSI